MRPARDDSEIRRLIERMLSANPLWRASRIHGELKMLGIPISERTVAYHRDTPQSPTQTWKIVSSQSPRADGVDGLLTVPAVTLKVLFVFIVLEHRRRQVLHFNLTHHPARSLDRAQQIVEAFAGPQPARYVIRDRDSIYRNEVRGRIASLRMQEVVTAPQSPGRILTRRLIGSVRRGCLNHFVILNSSHLKWTLTLYFRHYHSSSTLALEKQCPLPRAVVTNGRIVETHK